MKELFLSAFFPLCLLVMTSCGTDSNKDSNQRFIDLYGGDPYTGPVSVNIMPPEELRQFDYGDASAHFIDKGDGQAQLIVYGAIEDDSGETGDAGFMIEGTYGEAGWKSELNDVTFEIDENGIISGGGTLHPQLFQFEGSLKDNKFELIVELEMLEETAGGFPAGTKFEFDYRLYRSAGGSNNENCSNIRYEMRPVANIGAGTIDMIQVPICLD